MEKISVRKKTGPAAFLCIPGFKAGIKSLITFPSLNCMQCTFRPENLYNVILNGQLCEIQEVFALCKSAAKLEAERFLLNDVLTC
jgi:hypothetical protein